MNREIGALTGLRGVAAAYVLVWHVFLTLRPEDPGRSLAAYLGGAGYLGVDIFFVLSGFVLALNYSRAGASVSDYASFLWKRLARIYPVHIATLVLFALVAATGIFGRAGLALMDSGTLTQQVLLTQAWSLPTRAAWNGVSWSLSCEWLAYLCFPVIAACAARMRSPLTGLIVIGALFGLFAHFVLSTGFHSPHAYGLVRIAVEFPAGVILHRIWVHYRRPSSVRFDVLAIVSAVALFAGSNAINALTEELLFSMAFTPILACVLVYSLACSCSVAKRLLSNKVMLHLGRVSFAFYMVHQIVLMTAAGAIERLRLTDVSALCAVLLSVGVAYGCAVALYSFIEEPSRRWMVGLGRRLPEASRLRA